MIGQISLTVRRTDSGGQIQVRARAVHVAANAPRKVCQYREGARKGEYLVRPRRRALVLQEDLHLIQEWLIDCESKRF